MIKTYITTGILGMLILFTFQVQGVLFASDYLHLYENGEMVPNSKVIITFQPSDNEIELFQDIYTDGVFEWSQVEKGNISFYIVDTTDLIPYPDWLVTIDDDTATYEMYIDEYISQQINESAYNLTIMLPEPEDTETHGDVIGSYRYFNVDLISGSVELIKVEIPKTSGFELIVLLGAVALLLLLMKRKQK